MVLNSTVSVYGVDAPKSVTFLNKRKSFKTYGFKFPIGDITDGNLLKKSSDLEVIKGSLKQLLLTSRGERVMLPNYGTNLKNYIMEPLDQSTLSQIRGEIIESITKYATGVKLLKIQIFPMENTNLSGGNHLMIRLFCALREEDSISFEVKVNL
jgi:phage baseplate assembly protein W